MRSLVKEIAALMQSRRAGAVLLIGAILSAVFCLPGSAQTPAQPGQQQPAQAQAPAAPQAAPAAAPATPAPAVTPTPTAAPQAPLLPPEITDPVSKLAKSIEGAEKSIQQLKELEGELSRLRGDVEKIIYDSTATAEQLRPQLAEVRSQIEKLGPPPAAGQPAETPTVASERARLNAMAGALDSAVKTTELAWVRAKQLIDRITVMRYQLFTRNLFERRDSPALPSVWRDVGERMDGVIGRARYYGGDWFGWARVHASELIALFVSVLFAYVASKLFIGRFIARRLVRPASTPTFFERVSKAAWVAPLRAIPGAFAAIAIYAGFASLDLLYGSWSGLGETALQGLLLFVAASALLRVALAPGEPAWRLVPVSDRTARRLLWLLEAFVAVYVIDTAVIEFGRIIYAPLVVTIAESFITSVLFAGLLVILLLTPFEPQIVDRPVNGHVFVPGPVSRTSPLWLKVPLWIIVVGILGSSLLGYIALGRFIAHQIVLSGVVLSATGIAYLAIRALTRGRPDGRHVIGEFLETRFGIDAPRQRQLSRLTELVLSLALLMAAVPVLLLQWGFAGADIRDWFSAAVFGFEVGHLKISLARILIGIVLFMLMLFLTRVLQRWLREGVLTQSRMDVGISNSIDQAVGYSGTALAALLAVSYAGFDITSLAIVAGALSVGIGFGLQSIVNNFVSGLILLVERPIKVGDWIVVGDQQGIVRRISVRSTEVETFDRASLIMPNSELVSGRVLNWTHRNSMGRVAVKFTLEGGVDPAKILKIMTDCADAHDMVLKTPAPASTLDQFSATSLEFTLRVTLADIMRGAAVATELRLAILDQLRKSGQITMVPITQSAVTADSA